MTTSWLSVTSCRVALSRLPSSRRSRRMAPQSGLAAGRRGRRARSPTVWAPARRRTWRPAASSSSSCAPPRSSTRTRSGAASPSGTWATPPAPAATTPARARRGRPWWSTATRGAAAAGPCSASRGGTSSSSTWARAASPSARWCTRSVTPSAWATSTSARTVTSMCRFSGRTSWTARPASSPWTTATTLRAGTTTTASCT
mmetsp:Transcript_125320/g.390156  ORF Transcript_125320/g.390156 Transcript_125320/m.390156 type:complete len:201 (-) Transcript_125320:1353-1955(-)